MQGSRIFAGTASCATAGSGAMADRRAAAAVRAAAWTQAHSHGLHDSILRGRVDALHPRGTAPVCSLTSARRLPVVGVGGRRTPARRSVLVKASGRGKNGNTIKYGRCVSGDTVRRDPPLTGMARKGWKI
jgi:hypothetical protein